MWKSYAKCEKVTLKFNVKSYAKHEKFTLNVKNDRSAKCHNLTEGV